MGTQAHGRLQALREELRAGRIFLDSERRKQMNLPDYSYKLCSVRKLDAMPLDKRFGNELCHATGYEVLINGEWWNEYEDSDGNPHYGR